MKIHGTAGYEGGSGIIKKYYPRLVGLLGFRPVPGTLNVRLERDLDLRHHATKAIDHVLQDGRRHVDAYLAPVKIKRAEERRMLGCDILDRAPG